LIASTTDTKKRQVFDKLAKDIKQLADDVGAEIVARRQGSLLTYRVLLRL
jgi:hypothetical protein